MGSMLPEPKPFELPPVGLHPAVCVQVLDLGTQETNFGRRRQIKFTWELGDERTENNEPFWVGSRYYTWSMSTKSHLRNDLESWRGKAFEDSDFGEGGFDIKNILGAPCMLNLIADKKNNGEPKVSIQAITRLAKGLTPPVPEADLLFIWLEPDLFDHSAFGKLTDYWQDLIKKSPEFQALQNGGAPATQSQSVDDEIPF